MEGRRPAPLQSCFNLNNHAPTQKRAAVAHQPEIARIARHQRATAAEGRCRSLNPKLLPARVFLLASINRTPALKHQESCTVRPRGRAQCDHRLHCATQTYNPNTLS
jgi:hypothetical protein